ncbi:MAG: RNA methyltransferase [Bacteroidales bacterium]
MKKFELINYLQNFVTEDRLKTFNKVLSQRTRYLTVALEDIYQPHNASAVLRSMDCFGVQDAHIIENQNEYRVNPDVALGASKWINLHYYNKRSDNSLEAIEHLKKKGYRIVSTTPHSHEVELEEFDLEKGPFVLFFGTELTGLTANVLDNSDEFLKIPMYGFTESFNISVSAAVILHHLSWKLRKSDVCWELSEEEKIDLKFEWLKKSVKRSNLLIDKFLSQRTNL